MRRKNNNVVDKFDAVASKNSAIEVFAKLIERASDLSRKSIKNWREALEVINDSRSPTFREFIDIYEDLRIDGHLDSLLQLRNDSILNTPFSIVNDSSETDKEATKLLNKQWFFDLIKDIMETTYFGTCVIEFKEVTADKVVYKVIPRQNCVPKKKIIYIDAERMQDKIDYSLPIYSNRLVQIGKDNNIGIINNIVPQLIWSRHAEQSWSEFCERFGLPMITATSNKQGGAELSKIEKKLKDLGESATAVLPTGTTIDIKQPTNTDAYKVYLERINKCENKIAKQIVGGTMLTDNGASRSQGEVHERNLDDKISVSDARMVEFVINDQILPLLRSFGLAIGDNCRFEFDKSITLGVKELLELILKLNEQYNIPMEWLSKRFNIPIDSIKEPAPTPPPPAPEPPKPKPKQRAEVEFLGIEMETTQSLWDKIKSLFESQPPTKTPFINPSSKLNSAEEAYNSGCPTCANGEIEDRYTAKAGHLLDAIKSITERISGKVFKETLEHSDTAELVVGYKDVFEDGLAQGWDNYYNIDYDTPDALCRQAMEMNLFNFSAAKSASLINQMNDLLIDADGKRRSFSSFKDEVTKLDETINTRFLKTEYNHAVAVGQSTASYWRMMKNKKEIPYWEYQTVGDDRVREKHALLDGKIFSLDDKSSLKLMPPNDFNDRCEGIEYVGEPPTITSGKDGIAILGDGQNKNFLVNWADDKTVYNAGMMTLKGTKPSSIGAVISAIVALTWKDYGLEENPISKLILKLSNQTIDEVVKGFGKRDRPYLDYLGRATVLTFDDMKKHVSYGKYADEKRHLLVEHISDVLTKPDEVYMFERNKKMQMKYFKHYKDKTLVVISDTGDYENEKVRIRTFFESREDGVKRDGLLVYGKKKVE